MSVLNRAMFNQTVNRQEGLPPAGEENFFEKFASLLRGQKSDPIRTEEGFTVNEIENILNTPASSSLPVSMIQQCMILVNMVALMI